MQRLSAHVDAESAVWLQWNGAACVHLWTTMDMVCTHVITQKLLGFIGLELEKWTLQSVPWILYFLGAPRGPRSSENPRWPLEKTKAAARGPDIQHAASGKDPALKSTKHRTFLDGNIFEDRLPCPLPRA